jgi:hypothetical protein
VLETGAEYGPLGPLLLFIIAAEFFFRARRLRRVSRAPLERALGAALMVEAITMIVVSFKDGIWEQQMVSMWLWILGGFVVVSLSRLAPASQPAPAKVKLVRDDAVTP